MYNPLIKLKQHLQTQIHLIQSAQVDLMDKMILTRSLLENYAILNFLKINDSAKRIELFQCFGDFEWYSHQIYYSHPTQDRIYYFNQFLKRIQRNYPFGYSKYGRLIKRRLCKHLRYLIKHQSKATSHWQHQLDLINSNKTNLVDRQRLLLAKYMSYHLITKLPFPYRVIFGKSITYFVLKYSPVNRTTYWLLADLSHGTLVENHINPGLLSNIIKKIIQIINSRINQK